MTILEVVGRIAMVVGSIWLLVLAFREGLLWGFGSLLIPFVALIFALMHFHEAKKPLFITIVGGLLWGTRSLG